MSQSTLTRDPAGSSETSQERPPSRGRLATLRSTPELLVLAFLVLLCAALTVAEPRFLTEANLQNVGRQTSVLITLAAGVLFVLLVGGIDLSVAGSIAFASVVAAGLADSAGVPVAFLTAIAVCTGIGLVNGLLIGVGSLSPIVVTLAMGQMLLGGALLLTRTGPIQPEDLHYGDIAATMVGPVPLLVLVALGCLLVAHVILKRLALGRYIYAVGGNETAAWLAGVPTARVKVAGYTLAGMFAGTAGVLLSSRVGTGDANLGGTIMLSAYAAVFIGGVGFGTGRGNVSGAALGALILGVITNGIDLKGLNTDYQYIVGGALIILAIAFQVIPGKLRGRRQ